MALTHAQMQAYLRGAGWPASHLAIMSAIGMAESSGIPNNGGPSYSARHKDTNGRWSVGLWQINSTDGAKPGTGRNGVSNSALEDPATNARVALDIFRSQGFKAWGTYTSGAYKKYLAAATAAAGGSPVTVPPGGRSSPAEEEEEDNTGKILLGAAVAVLLIRRL